MNRRTLALALTAATAATAVLTVLPADAATTTADAPWSGYKIAADTTAGGDWLGARKVGTQVVYRVDPGKKTLKSAGFGTGAWTSTLAGTGPRAVTTLDTARAAWILGKYGTYQYAVQNAAVDVAVRHLLYGGTWALTGASTTKRLASTPQPTAIRDFATTMINDSNKYAGPYSVTVTTGQAPSGGQVPVTVRVLATRTGTGVDHLPVAISYSGGTTASLQTGTDGTATTSFPTGAVGPHTISVTVDKVPETRLQVRTPTTAGASRVVVAGLKTTRTVTAVATTKVSPTSTVTATKTQITTTQSPTGQLEVSGGYASPRTATASLYGPFDSAAAVSCTPAKRAVSGTLTVNADGAYALPATLLVPRYGYYVWGTTVAANDYNNATSACGGTVLARVTPGIRVDRAAASYRVGASVHGVITTTGLPTPYGGSAEVRLYGPFNQASDAGCNISLLLATQSAPLTGDTPTNGPDTKISRPGYYFWAASLPAGSFNNAATSSCTATGATFQVSW